MKTLYSSCIVLGFMLLFLSCKKSTPDQDSNSTSAKSIKNNNYITRLDSIIQHQIIQKNMEDSILANQFISVVDWDIDDFIVKEKDRSSQSLRRMIEYTKEEWRQVQNPIIATYKGCDFGDYFHINFEDSKGNRYNFGWGNNHLGDYQLFDEVDYNDNPKYLGKIFQIKWNWKISKFPCCEGEYDMVEAYLPSITQLEILEKQYIKK